MKKKWPYETAFWLHDHVVAAIALIVILSIIMVLGFRSGRNSDD